MKSRKIIIFVAMLFLFTAIAASIHLSTRQEVPENILKIMVNNKEYMVDIDKLKYEQVTGMRINGKGEEIPVEGQGIRLQDVLVQADIADYTEVKVVSDDSYSAVLYSEEVADEETAFLFVQEEKGLRLVVFGDENSKRSVSNVVQIVVE